MLLVNQIKACHPELTVELITMKTTGDRILDRRLDQAGGKGLFVKELDQALADGKIDLSVHSLKDMPMEENRELPIVAYSTRGDPRDALVLPQNSGGFSTDRIGTSSLRRSLQLSSLFPEAETKLVRGNVLTRLQKLDAGEYTALILAASGLSRLGLSGRISRYFSTDEIIPAAGQGILAVQGRKGEDYDFLDCIRSEPSKAAALAERGFVSFLEGGCSSPVAAYAEVSGQEIRLSGLYFEEESGQYATGRITGDVENARKLGEELAERLRREGV